MQGGYIEPGGEGQSRKNSHKSSALRRSDATRRSPPLPPATKPFGFELDVGEAVVGTLPAAPGTRVALLDCNGNISSEHAVAGFIVLRGAPDPVAHIFVRPISPLGVIGGRFALIEPDTNG